MTKRVALFIVAMVLALALGRWTALEEQPEQPVRVRVVKEPVFIPTPQPAPVAPSRAPTPKAMLEDVRRAWGIEGALSCAAVSR